MEAYFFHDTLHGEWHKIDGLVQEKRYSIANALELLSFLQ